MSTLTFSCPNCQARVNLKKKLEPIGKKIRCKKCKRVFALTPNTLVEKNRRDQPRRRPQKRDRQESYEVSTSKPNSANPKMDKRMPRGEFAVRLIISFLAALAVSVFPLIILAPLLKGTNSEILGILFILLIIGVWATYVVYNIRISIKRLHDMNQSGILVLCIFIPIPYAALIFLLLLCLIPGTEGPNKYGPDPFGSPGDLTEKLAIFD